MTDHYFRSLNRNIILIIIVVSVIPLIIVSSTIYYQFRTSYHEKVYDHLRELVHSHSRNIDYFLQEKLSDIRSLTAGYGRDKLEDESFLQERLIILQRNQRPDLVMLDIMMPKMDGIEVCRHLRADSSLPFMPIIMVTAKADSKDVVAGLEAGADEYLTKPVNHAALVARVKSMLRIKSLHDTVIEQSAQLQGQLKTATKIQSLFWPDIQDLEGGSHIWAEAIPAAYVSGDLYDVIPLPDGSLLAYVADVSDKGVPAALVMAALSTKIRSEAQNDNEIDTLLQTVNNSIYNLISGEGFFATIVIVRYWPQSGKMQLSMGGHLLPLWIAGSDIRNLPKLNGVEVLKRLKQKSPDTEVIMITGYGDIKSAVDSIKQGARDYITKPFKLDEILALVKQAVKENRDHSKFQRKATQKDL